MKSIKMFLALLLLSVAQVFADVAIYNPAASTNTVSIIGRAASIQNILFANGTGAAVTVTLHDAPAASLTYEVGAYTNDVVTTSSVVTTFTNTLGVIQSRTNSVLVRTPTAVSAATADYRTVTIVTIPANSTFSWTPPGNGIPVGFGLAGSTSAVGVTATVTYLPTR